MELIDTIHQIINQSLDAFQTTELAIGTVATVNPLSVTLNANLPPIPEEALILTDSVKRRIVHATDGTGKGTGTGKVRISQEDVDVTDVDVTDVEIDVEVQSDLQVGDAVILLRVMKGQQFIILSKVV